MIDYLFLEKNDAWLFETLCNFERRFKLYNLWYLPICETLCLDIHEHFYAYHKISFQHGTMQPEAPEPYDKCTEN